MNAARAKFFAEAQPSTPAGGRPQSMAPPEDAQSPREGVPLQALIVEDSLPIAERLIDLVSTPGQVEVAATATTEKEAIAACEGRLFDLAIVDLQLAQGTGFGVIRRLRASAGRHTTIVVLTNHAVPALRVASFEAGADHFLDKSKDFASVPGIVAEMLASRN